MRLKPGVSLKNIKPELIFAWQVAHGIYTNYGYELVITSGTEEAKHTKYSAHYLGYAIDLRIRMFKFNEAPKIVAELKNALGEDYLIILHDTHIHIEFRPNR